MFDLNILRDEKGDFLIHVKDSEVVVRSIYELPVTFGELGLDPAVPQKEQRLQTVRYAQDTGIKHLGYLYPEEVLPGTDFKYARLKGSFYVAAVFPEGTTVALAFDPETNNTYVDARQARLAAISESAKLEAKLKGVLDD